MTVSDKPRYHKAILERNLISQRHMHLGLDFRREKYLYLGGAA